MVKKMSFRNTFLLLFVIASLGLKAQHWTGAFKPEILKNGTGFSNHDQATASAMNPAGDVLVTGFFEGEIVFGGDTLRTVGNRDIFVAKLNKNGYWDWAVSAGGSNADYGRGIAVDANGNIYVTGYFYHSAKFGAHTITGLTNTDIFIAKLNSSGIWQWAKSAPGFGFNRGNSIDIDPAGNCFVTGAFEGTVSFGSINLSSSGSRDLFVTKMNTNGDFIWAVKAGGSSAEEAATVKYYASDRTVYIAGGFAGSASFGSQTLNSVGGRDVFVAKLDSSGVFQWAIGAGSNVTEDCKYMSVDGSGSAIITGYYAKSFSFGSATLPTPGNEDAFVAKIDKNGSWLWATTFGGTGFEQGLCVTNDNTGASYISGYFTGTASFGSTNLTSLGDRNAFVVKLNASGSVLWVRGITGLNTIECFTLATASNGITYPMGAFYDNAIVGADTLHTLGNSDIFAGRISSTGNWSWALSAGGVIGFVNVNAVASNQNGDYYACGSFYGTIVFGNDTLKSQGESDIFIAKSDNNGNWLWGRIAGGKEADVANGVTVDNAGNVVVTGYFSGSAKFGTTMRNTNGQGDIFVAKLSPTGAWTWVLTAGEKEFDEGKALVTDVSGNIYVTGYFSDKPWFGTTRLTSAGRDDVFVAKMNSAGQWQWAVRGGSSQFDVGNGIDIDSNGNIYITGGFEGNAAFGTNTVSSKGGDDIFIAKLNNSGTWLWAVSAGTNSFQEYGTSIKVYNNTSVYATGTFKGLCLFGSQYLIGAGNSDAFITKLNQDGEWQWSRSLGGSGFDVGRSVVVDALGAVKAVGYFTGSASIHGTPLTTLASRASYFVKLSPDGNLLYAKSDSSLYSEAKSIADLGNGKYIIAGIYYGRASFGSLQLSEAIDLDFNSYFAFDGVASPSTVWNFKSNTGKSSTISIAASVNPIIGMRYMAVGDAIGVFYLRNSNLYCAGYSIWTGNDLTITVWGDDVNTAVKDGMADNEQYIVKLFDAITTAQYLVTPRYISGPPYFVDNSVTVISRLPDYPDTLHLPLNNGWNMVASYINAENPSMESIFAQIQNHISIVKDNLGQVYMPEYEINSIGDWDITQGYQVHSKKIQTLKIVGSFIKPENITLYPKAGWNIIAYLRSSPYDAQDAFAPLIEDDNLVIAKNNEGDVLIPEYDINTIGNLMPMQGYQVFLRLKDTLVYPANSLGKASLSEQRYNYEPVYFKPYVSQTGVSAVLLVHLPNASDGSEIAVLTPSGHIAGATKVFEGKAPITIWGNNPVSRLRGGFNENDEMNFIVYDIERNSTEAIRNLQKFDITGNKLDRILFKSNSYYTLKQETTTDNYFSFSLYPNPASTYVWINIWGDYIGMFEYEISDINGKIISKNTLDKSFGSKSEMITFGNIANGIYNIVIRYEDKIKIEKFIINK